MNTIATPQPTITQGSQGVPKVPQQPGVPGSNNAFGGMYNSLNSSLPSLIHNILGNGVQGTLGNGGGGTNVYAPQSQQNNNGNFIQGAEKFATGLIPIATGLGGSFIGTGLGALVPGADLTGVSEMSSITNLANTVLSSNTQLSGNIANLNAQQAQIIEQYSSGAMTQAEALTALQATNQTKIDSVNELAQVGLGQIMAGLYGAQTSLQGAIDQAIAQNNQAAAQMQSARASQVSSMGNILTGLGNLVTIVKNNAGEYVALDKVTGKPVATGNTYGALINGL